MLSIDNNTKAFLELARAGLWEKEARLLPFNDIDYSRVLTLAEEQSVVGLVAAGLAHVSDIKAPQEDALQFVGKALQLEQRNQSMNHFIGIIVDKMQGADIYTILVKGQGVAQCYERPLWRTSGDIDLFFSKENYFRALDLLKPLSSNSKVGGLYSKEVGLTINQWFVEVHGTQRTGLSTRLDKEIDCVQSDTFYAGNVRSWMNGNTIVFLPSPDNDVFFIFTHFLKHFYKEVLTLRQICDWCRLLWVYRETIDVFLLKNRLLSARIMNEWNAFAALAVDYLGLPVDSMPLYCTDEKWGRKAEEIMNYIIGGCSGRKYKDTIRLIKIFPTKTIGYLPSIIFNVNWLKIKERFYEII